ncbi:DUF6059 family protein [Streptomyces sp. NBC_01013]|uniref:DUF6059 family protein n=1 Tax=Streptomyces sp. NBC_01013 TaxID=2903718 RepID=UPI0038686712|nr:hypothetical protein OG538_32760 [Streptomyces sp. NBC_01013]
MRILLARFLRSCADALVAFGQIWVHIPPVPVPEDGPPGGPPPGHPERLCPEVPLSEAEMTWGRQLLGVAGPDPYEG